ncbi:VanZ family protein [Clostridium sp. CM028]|uniref:VanZ family protein n=1 Tax=unclassified Clostridium TaxID=2614128 RepID=UPI001C0BAD6D|nr:MULTISPECIES: VanZ family protein [unclassified Clostridium]MBU3093043.1 VanZ family protein [Clostridium sp. CF011]MBW9148567.1 VanZ family protein [Clostridium sp. CM028]WAG69098.1 VanZ family protein [Clostridium sp. CF011]WLC60834.1 VanZ family protein [Clostridium sp. CM028]
MLHTYLQNGIFAFHYSIRIALIVFCVFNGIKSLVKRKLEFKPLGMLCEFAWILTVLVILNITGIIGGNFGTTSISDGNVQFSFVLFEEGLSPAILLNIILFIPFGFFSAIVFKKLRDKWIYGVLIGLTFSVMIEFLQTFTGRFVELDDVLMNTVGTFIGYEIWFWLSKFKQRQKK